jgi:photosystem II stability/assembly factor-like uncharacterized protein
MPDDFDDLALRAGQAMRDDARVADAALPAPSPRRSVPRRALAVAVAAAILIALGGAFVVTRDDDEHRVDTSATTRTTITVVPPFNALSASFASPARAFVLGRRCDTCPLELLRTDDRGERWHTLTVPPGAIVRAVRYADHETLYLYGDHLWVSHDGGRTWRNTDIPVGQVQTMKTRDGVAYAINGAGELYTTSTERDDPWQLADQFTEPFGGGELVLRGTHMWHLDTAGEYADRRIGDQPWTLWPVPCTKNIDGPAHIAALDASELAIACDGRVFRSHDGGDTFDAGQPLESAQLVTMATRDLMLVATDGGVTLTVDGGHTWQLTLPLDHAATELGFTTATQAYVIAGEEMYLTTDGGETWTPVVFAGT